MVHEAKEGIWYKWHNNNQHIRVLEIVDGKVKYEYSDGHSIKTDYTYFISEVDECPELNTPSTDSNFGEEQTSSAITPSHYNSTKIDALSVIDDWQLSFRLANTIKYIQRHLHKGKPIEDLEKGLQYLQLEIQRLRDAS